MTPYGFITERLFYCVVGAGLTAGIIQGDIGGAIVLSLVTVFVLRSDWERRA